MVGTVSYMPPEQAMGGEVTPQSDLYSLGAMLYEMVTGRPPFLGDDSVAIIGQHINTPPVAPAWHNSECPRALEALILRLLTKDPTQRPESAADVLTALEGIDLAASAEGPAPEHDEAHALDSLAGGVFVGRQREMGELKGALEDALSGRGRLVTLVGEPGIGKTRTSEELATYARMRGAQVFWGRCYEEQGVPPYWPWVQAIRSYVREREPEQLRSEMGAGAADIAEVVSDVRARLPELEPAPSLDDPEQARFRLFDSIAAFLRTSGQKQPLLIVLDDLHWADKPSLMLLQFVARELANSRVLMVGTYRDVELNRQHPLAETLGELNRERLFARVLLRGLDAEDIARFIEITSGIKPPQALVAAVHTQTEGNPLFVTEVVRLLVQEGELTTERAATRDSWTVRIPEGVREVIGRRLNRLSQRCNETLTIAAVVGREFELRQLEPLVDDLSEDRLLDVLEEGLDARVIEELPGSVGRYQFTHALIQETLGEELSLTRRVRLHARIAEAYEELYADSVEANAAALAHHFAQAEAVLGSEKLVRYSMVAGERALAAYAFEEALEHFQRALAAREPSAAEARGDGALPPARDAEEAAILFGLARAQAATVERHDVQRAVDTLGRALDYYVDVGDVDGAASVAEFRVEAIGGLTRQAHVLARALEVVPHDSPRAGELLARYGGAVGIEEGNYEGAQAAFAEALAIARREDDRALEMWTLVYAASVDGQHLRRVTSLEHALKAIELARSLDDPYAELQAHHFAFIGFHYRGDRENASAHARAMMPLAERLRQRVSSELALGHSSSLAFSTGDWAEARELNDRLLALTPGSALAIGLRALVEHEVGNFSEGAQYIERLIEAMRLAPSGPNWWHIVPAVLIPLSARITGSSQLLATARSAAQAVVFSPLANPMRVALGRAGIALITVHEQDVAGAQEQHEALAASRGTVLTAVGISVDRLLGLLAQTIGKLDEAATHFEEGLDFCRKAGYRPELAWTCCDYADMLLERNDGGDRQKATTLLDESLAISSDLGMRPLMERVLSRKMSLQGIDVSSPQTSIDAVVSAVEVERPNLEPHAAPDGTVTVMFTDIEGSTAMTERLGDARAQEVLRVHNAIIREQVAAHDGFEVKSQGDGFMVAFSSARRALQCSMAIQQTLGAHNAENPDEPIKVRVGLHTGEAIKEGDDFFGKTVILAARIASQAEGEQILVSSLLKALVESSGEFEFRGGRAMELKGLAGTHQVFEVNLP